MSWYGSPFCITGHLWGKSPSQWSMELKEIIITVTSHHDDSNHRHFDCLFNTLLMLITKKTSKLRITGILLRVSGGFQPQRASDTESVSMSWYAHGINYLLKTFVKQTMYEIDTGTIITNANHQPITRTISLITNSSNTFLSYGGLRRICYHY